MHLVAGLCPDPLGELTALPRPPSWIKGGREGDREEGGEEMKKPEDPPMSEVR